MCERRACNGRCSPPRPPRRHLGLLSIFAGLFLARFGTPLLLAFLAIGLLFGEQGPVGLVFNDFQTSYLIGSVALAVILFEGGLKTKRSMLKIALGPALALATAGVAITAASAPCSPCFPLHLRPTRLGS
jgi:NhaP-type Na+/H+ and K+/H+ antiporter